MILCVIKILKQLLRQSPAVQTIYGQKVCPEMRAQKFVEFFSGKVEDHVKSSIIDNHVYNGKCRLIVANRNFMTKSDVKECMLSLKNKKSEGYDRIPVCCLLDAKDTLLEPMSALFDKIYLTKKVPDQWKVSKIIPIHKKGSKTAIENYRPIANLCSASKIFETIKH